MGKKTVLITGCSSGFGKLTAKKFQQEGWNVIATMRSPEKEQELNKLDNVFVTRLDVTDQKSVEEAVRQGIERFDTIDVLVNNAGYGGHALFEQFSEEQIYAMYETNVFGLMRVSRAVLAVMQKQKSGTIINITSMAGILGLPFASTYSSTKFAVEGLSEGMALEYKPFNIKVKTIAPGAFGTNFSAATDNSIESGDNELESYALKLAAHFSILVEQMLKTSGKEADPQDVADIIYKCATKETPIHNIVGADAQMLMELKYQVPARLSRPYARNA
jgi:NAD(P)-dependent dehydrogenase (short-subunit alcohol dehydrogenase family)